jgi:hypothetical protein
MGGRQFGLGAAVVAIVVACGSDALAQAQPRCGTSYAYLRDGSRLRYVYGTPGRQRVEIVVAPGAISMSLDCNGDGDFQDAAVGDLDAETETDIAGFQLDLHGGDLVSITLTAPAGENLAPFHTIVDLGGGMNTVQLKTVGSVGLDAALVLDVRGGAGPDTIGLDLQNAVLGSSGVLRIRNELGAGNDALSVALPAVLSGGSVALDAVLGPGANAFSLDAGKAVFGSRLDVNVTGDLGPDAVRFDWHALLDARTIVRADLGGGNDTLIANFDLDPFGVGPNGELHTIVSGGDGNDTIRAGSNGTVAAGGTSGLLDFDLNGNAGNDVIAIDFGNGGFPFQIGGGERYRVDGGAGQDLITVNLESTNGVHDISISGGPQPDRVTFNQNASGPSNVWLGGAAFVDGSFGTPDVCVVTSNGPVRRRNCER